MSPFSYSPQRLLTLRRQILAATNNVGVNVVIDFSTSLLFPSSRTLLTPSLSWGLVLGQERRFSRSRWSHGAPRTHGRSSHREASRPPSHPLQAIEDSRYVPPPFGRSVTDETRRNDSPISHARVPVQVAARVLRQSHRPLVLQVLRRPRTRPRHPQGVYISLAPVYDS